MTRSFVGVSLFLACATAAPVAATSAQTAASQPTAKLPNLSGTWELNVAASNFGPQGAPTKETMTVTQAGNTLTRTQMLSSPQGDVTMTMHNVVGASTTDTVRAQGQQMPFTSTSRWEGTTLVIDGKVMVQETEIPVVARYTLSADGKQLIVDQVVTTPMGEMTQHRVYDKKS